MQFGKKGCKKVCMLLAQNLSIQHSYTNSGPFPSQVKFCKAFVFSMLQKTPSPSISSSSFLSAQTIHPSGAPSPCSKSLLHVFFRLFPTLDLPLQLDLLQRSKDLAEE